jgi:glycine/D-amino acid oxidase-like deaminating enzyme
MLSERLMGDGLGVGVIGAGYVGLATAACLAHLGHRVVCVEKDQERLRGLKEGRVPFYEPGFEELLWRGVRTERLSFAGLFNNLARLVGEARSKKPRALVTGGAGFPGDLQRREMIADLGKMVGRSFHLRLASAGRGLREKVSGWGR